MAASKSTGKVAMRPGLIQVIARIIRARIVANPGFSIHMRLIGMAGLVTIVTIRRHVVRLGGGLGAGLGDRWMTRTPGDASRMLLRKPRRCKNEQRCKS
jgi:hypothetical protein